MKRKLLLIFTLIIAINSALAYDFALENEDGIEIYYNIVGDKASVTYRTNSYKSYSGVVVIPEQVTYNDITYQVTEIGSSAFFQCGELTQVLIPEGVTTISSGAFAYCSALKEITIPQSVTYLGKNYSADVFRNCTSLAVVNFNAIDCTTKNYNFTGCSALTTVNIGANVKKIPPYFCTNCAALAEVNMSESVTSIEYEAFKGCVSLTNFTIPKSVKLINSYAFSGCTNLAEVDIPDDAELNIIGANAFAGCTNLKEFTITENVNNIGAQAFARCQSLTTVNFNAINCENMGSTYDYVFKNCTSLININIGNKVTNLPNNAFNGCSAISEICIPENVAKIGTGAFTGCVNLKTVYFNAINCGEAHNAFSPCKSLTNVFIGNNVTQISNNLFTDCKEISRVVFPNSVIYIGIESFRGCTSLKEIYLPESIGTIGTYAFGNCTALDKITALMPDPQDLTVSSTSFGGVSTSTCKLFVPYNSLDMYSRTIPWKDFLSISVVPLESLSFEENEYELFVDESIVLPLSITPSQSYATDAIWESSDDSIATVDETGTVTGVGVGSVIITVASGGISASCTVNVKELVGVGLVRSDKNDMEVSYYDIKGIKVETSNLRPGVYIRKNNHSTSLIYIK